MISPKKSVQELVRISEKEPSRLFKQRMDRNERTYPYSEAFVNFLREQLTSELIMIYPEIEPLYEKFAKWLGVGRDQLLFHTGSDLAIKAIFETYISLGDKILLHLPGYAMYKVYANMFQAKVEFLEYDSNLNFDMGKYIEMLDGNYRMAVIENPNGFIGNKHSIEEIKRFIAKAHELGVLVLMDEAYFHFIDETTADFVAEFDNLIVVRTFSKAFGLAGLRAAYLLSQPANIQNLYRVKPMHELNAMAVVAVSALLEHEDELKKFIKETKESRNYLARELNALGIKTSDSRANFLAVKFGPEISGMKVSNYLKRFDFLIRRPFREEHLKHWSRVGTLPLEKEKEMIAHLKEFIRMRKMPAAK